MLQNFNQPTIEDQMKIYPLTRQKSPVNKRGDFNNNVQTGEIMHRRNEALNFQTIFQKRKWKRIKAKAGSRFLRKTLLSHLRKWTLQENRRAIESKNSRTHRQINSPDQKRIRTIRKRGKKNVSVSRPLKSMTRRLSD